MQRFTGMNFAQLDKLNVFVFWLYLRDAVIYNASMTEDGRDWLERCWVQQQTEPDRETLRKLFGQK